MALLDYNYKAIKHANNKLHYLKKKIIEKLHYTLLKMYKLRLSFSGTWHSDGCCCSMVHYKNHWGQLKRGHASLISNILWCFPCLRTAAYKGHFFSPRSPAAKREEGLLAAWSCAGMLEWGCCFSLFRWARVCSVVLRGPREHQQPANISCKNGGTCSRVMQRPMHTLSSILLDLC